MNEPSTYNDFANFHSRHKRMHVVVAEPSDIIRNGLVHILKQMTDLPIDVGEITDIPTIVSQLEKYHPDILIVNPMHLGVFSIMDLKGKLNNGLFSLVALQNMLTSEDVLKNYDAVISIYDTAGTIKAKLLELLNINRQEEEKKELSDREKEVIVCIVKGMSNKQIADALCLSTYTVMTHRRNIVNKLQIHSSSGLTIYAIVNKLVTIDEIKDTIYSEE